MTIRFAILFATLLSAHAATLEGIVKDQQGRAVPSAQVRLFRQDNPADTQSVTGPEGRFRMERLAPGTYLLQIEKDGFGSSASTLTLHSDDTLQRDFTLQVQAVAESVLVTAAGTPQKLDEISKSVSVISSEEIQNRDEYALSDVLRTVPGVIVTNGGGPGQNTSIRLRGLRADASSILIDGMRFRDTTTLQGDASSFISALNIIAPDRIEILRGSGSSLYGTNAVGGVINVVTKEGGGPLHEDLQIEGGNLGLFRAHGTFSGGALHDRLKFSGGLLHLNITEGVDGYDANRSTGGQGFARYSLTPKIALSARFWGSDDFVMTNNSPTTSGLPSANFPASGIVPAIPLSAANVAVLNAGGKPDYTGATFIPGRDDPDSRRGSRLFTTALLYRQELTAQSGWQASYQRVHTSREYSNGPAGGGFQPVTSNYSHYTGNIDTADIHANATLARFLTITGGYEFERETYFDTQRNNLPAPRTLTEQTDTVQRSNAGYFAAQLSSPDRRLQVSLSGRLQAFDLSRPNFIYSGIPNPYSSAIIPNPKTAVTGDASLAYLLPRTETKLRAHFGNAYRAPALYERFGSGFSNNPVTGQVNFTAYGDPRLAPDRYNSLDGGIDQYLLNNRIRLSATYFYTRIASLSAFDFSGAIRAATDPYGRSSGYLNGSGGISRGAELSVETRPLRSLSVSGSYTYVNENTDRDLSVPGFFKILQVPQHTGSLVATKTWSKRLDTTFYLSTYSSYYTPFFAGSGTRAFLFPGFTKVAIVGSYKIWQGERGSVRLYLKGDNILNESVYQAGWLNPRATVLGGIAYTH